MVGLPSLRAVNTVCDWMARGNPGTKYVATKGACPTGLCARAEPRLCAKLVRSVPGARFVVVPASDKTIGHLSLRLAALWKPYLDEALRSARTAAR